MRLVIDKSVLRALPLAQFLSLRERHQLLMTEALFYELMTCDPPQRAQLFRKIGGDENPLGVVPNPGFLWGRELAHGAPIDSASAAELNQFRWIFNPGLSDPNYALPDAVEAELVGWREHRAGEVRAFLKQAATIPEMFPNMQGVGSGASPEMVEEILRSLSGDSIAVREFFTLLAASSGERVPAGFGPDWVGYRSLQAQMIWAVDARWKHGENLERAKATENTVCDMEYAVAAAHADGLLSQDKALVRLTQLMEPRLHIADGSNL